jgi:hypothetical protein
MLFGVGHVAFNILDCGIFYGHNCKHHDHEVKCVCVGGGGGVNLNEGYFLGKFTTSLGGAWFPALSWSLP